MASNSKLINHIIRVFFSNIVSLSANVLIGFVLPKIMDIESFGYYKTFSLYSNYLSLLHLGILDGILLIYAGTDLEKINKEKFRFYTKFLISFQMLITIIGILFSVLFIKGEYMYIFILLSIYLWCININIYYQNFSQITSRFKEFSRRNILKGLLLFFLLSFLSIQYFVTKHSINYKLYLIAYIFVILLLTLWYIFTYRDITFGKSSKFADSKDDIILFVKTGLPLLFSTMCSNLIFNIDRQIVNIFYSNSQYARYAFAYSMVSLVTNTLTAVSTVLLPSLKKMNDEKRKSNYYTLIEIIAIISLLLLSLYFPLDLFISWFLKQYTDSLAIFRIVFPGIVLTCCINLVIHNYYKILNKSKIFFVYTLLIFITSLLLNLTAHFVFHKLIIISMSSIVSILLWFYVTNRHIIKFYKIKNNKVIFYIILMIIIFYLITVIKNTYISAGMYLLLYFLVTTLLYGKQLITKFYRKR